MRAIGGDDSADGDGDGDEDGDEDGTGDHVIGVVPKFDFVSNDDSVFVTEANPPPRVFRAVRSAALLVLLNAVAIASLLLELAV